MLDRITDRDMPASTIVLNGQVDGRLYEAQIRVSDLDQLAELATLQPGRSAQQGPVRVQILSNANGTH